MDLTKILKKIQLKSEWEGFKSEDGTFYLKAEIEDETIVLIHQIKTKDSKNINIDNPTELIILRGNLEYEVYAVVNDNGYNSGKFSFKSCAGSKLEYSGSKLEFEFTNKAGGMMFLIKDDYCYLPKEEMTPTEIGYELGLFYHQVELYLNK